MTELRVIEGSPGADPRDEHCRPPEFSDEALALRFAERHKDKLRFVAKWGHWLIWDGTRWAPDTTLAAQDLARGICREAAEDAAGCNEKKVSVSLASAKTATAVERLARSDRRLAATVDQWDTDPWLLNTPAGTIELRTGSLRAHRPEDHITKITAVAPGGDCPRFLRFMAEVTDDDGETQKFLQRLFGYSLTGSIQEHAMAFFPGNGGNGKSVLLGTVTNILGDYATTAPIETFVASNVDRHPTELAALRGARLVTATETEEGRQWAEAKLKALTGGDRIAARFMRQDFFEFVPVFKLIIAGNHKPGLRSVDEAIRRRLHLVPFSVTIPAEQRDTELPEKMKAEWSGILQWMLDGCLAWQKTGLQPPPAVMAATSDYLEQQDSLAAWIGECCTEDPDARETAKEMFTSWKHWALAAGIPPGKRTAFLDGLRRKGFHDHRTNVGDTFFGLQLTVRMTGPDYRD